MEEKSKTLAEKLAEKSSFGIDYVFFPPRYRNALSVRSWKDGKTLHSRRDILRIAPHFRKMLKKFSGTADRKMEA